MSGVQTQDSSSDPIETIVEEFLERRRRGERPSIAEYAQRRPDRAEEIREVLAALELVEDLGGGSDPGAAPDRLGDFRILREVGRGGMGVVYEAHQESLGRRVALKVMASTMLLDPEQLVRFKREAGVASRLDHPGICSVHAAGIEEGVPFIAMRFLDGETLARRISRERDQVSEDLATVASDGSRQNPPSAASPPTRLRTERKELLDRMRLVEDTARALHAAHEAGIVHRDVKPGNVMVLPEGRPVLLDFGLARDIQDEDPTVTRSGAVFGTAAYMSPEQVAGRTRQLDRRTDVYSLGVTLYELLTLRRPFQAPTRESLYRMILEQAPPDPQRLNAGIPRDLKTVLDVALEKEPDRRYQTAQDFADDLARVAAGEPTAVRPPALLVRMARWTRRRPALAVLLLVLAIAIPSIAGLSGFLLAKLPGIRRDEQRALEQQIEAHLEQGYLKLSGGLGPDATTDFAAALKLAPRRADALYGLARVHFGEGRHTAVVELLERDRAFTLSEAVLLSTYVVALERTGRAEQARTLRPASSGRPTTAFELFSAGNDLLQRGRRTHDEQRLRRAREYFHTAIQTAPSPRRLYHLHLLEVNGLLGDLPAIDRASQAILSLWDRSAIVLTWIGRAWTPHRPSRAVALLQEAVASDAGYWPAISALSQALLEAGGGEDAVRLLQRHVERHPGQASAGLALGTMLRETGRIRASEEVLRALHERHGDDAPALNALGVTLTRRGAFAEALAFFEAAARINPDDLSIRKNRALALRSNERFSEALDELLHLRKETPGDPHAWMAVADVQANLGERNAATATMLEAAARFSEDYQVQSYCGDLLVLRGDHEQALPYLRQAVALNDAEPRLQRGLGVALLRLQRFEEARQALTAAVTRAPSALSLCQLGAALQGLGRFVEAISPYARGHELGQRDPRWKRPSEAWLARARRLARHQQLIEETRPEDVPVPENDGQLAELASVAGATGNHPLAARLWSALYERAPASLADPSNPRVFLAARHALAAATTVEDGATRRALREQALRWLRARLDAWSARAEAGRLPTSVADELRRWTSHTDLAAVRERPALARLPAASSRAWSELWTVVERLLADL